MPPKNSKKPKIDATVMKNGGYKSVDSKQVLPFILKRFQEALVKKTLQRDMPLVAYFKELAVNWLDYFHRSEKEETKNVSFQYITEQLYPQYVAECSSGRSCWLHVLQMHLQDKLIVSDQDLIATLGELKKIKDEMVNLNSEVGYIKDVRDGIVPEFRSSTWWKSQKYLFSQTPERFKLRNSQLQNRAQTVRSRSTDAIVSSFYILQVFARLMQLYDNNEFSINNWPLLFNFLQLLTGLRPIEIAFLSQFALATPDLIRQKDDEPITETMQLFLSYKFNDEQGVVVKGYAKDRTSTKQQEEEDDEDDENMSESKAVRVANFYSVQRFRPTLYQVSGEKIIAMITLLRKLIKEWKPQLYQYDLFVGGNRAKAMAGISQRINDSLRDQFSELVNIAKAIDIPFNSYSLRGIYSSVLRNQVEGDKDQNRLIMDLYGHSSLDVSDRYSNWKVMGESEITIDPKSWTTVVDKLQLQLQTQNAKIKVFVEDRKDLEEQQLQIEELKTLVLKLEKTTEKQQKRKLAVLEPRAAAKKLKLIKKEENRTSMGGMRDQQLFNLEQGLESYLLYSPDYKDLRNDSILNYIRVTFDDEFKDRRPTSETMKDLRQKNGGSLLNPELQALQQKRIQQVEVLDLKK